MKKILFFVLVAGGFTACDDPSLQPGSSAGNFINVEDLINNQAQLLDSQHAQIDKNVWVNGQTEKQTIEDVNWEKELNAFKELDISKPGLQSIYSISAPQPHTRLYTLKSGEHAKVQWLKVTFAEDTTQLQSMEGLIKQTDYLYQSEKLLHADFDQNHFAGYRIASKKKILFGDEEMLKIQGQVASK